MKRYITGIFYLIIGIFFIAYPFYLNQVNGISLIPVVGSTSEPRSPGIVLSILGIGFLFGAFFTLSGLTKARDLPEPIYPYNKETKEIILPENIQRDLKNLYFRKSKSEAIIKLTELTGAELYLANDYIKNLTLKYNLK